MAGRLNKRTITEQEGRDLLEDREKDSFSW